MNSHETSGAPRRNDGDFQRQLDEHHAWLSEHDVDLNALKLWRARTEGFLTAMGLIAGLPTIVLGWYALTHIGK